MRKDNEIVPLKGHKCYDAESLFNLIAKAHALYKLKFGNRPVIP